MVLIFKRGKFYVLYHKSELVRSFQKQGASFQRSKGGAIEEAGSDVGSQGHPGLPFLANT